MNDINLWTGDIINNYNQIHSKSLNYLSTDLFIYLYSLYEKSTNIEQAICIQKENLKVIILHVSRLKGINSFFFSNNHFSL